MRLNVPVQSGFTVYVPEAVSLVMVPFKLDVTAPFDTFPAESREFMRRGVNQHTLEKICKREPVRGIKLARCLNAIEHSDTTRPH